MKTFFKYFSISAYVTAVLLVFLPVRSLADKTQTYRPPKGKVREQVRKAGGSRGCNLPLNDAVTLLVPQDHTATTISAHPTFFWHLSQKLFLPLRFTILEPGKKPILTKELKPEPGIVALELPQNSAPLEVGKTYRWTVTVVCNPHKPSRNLFAQAWIKRVPSKNLFSNSTKNTTLPCSLNYASAGIWYDALSCNYLSLIEKTNNMDSSWLQFQTLLKEINLEYLTQKSPKLSLY